MRIKYLFLLLLLTACFVQCKKDDADGGGQLNIFSVNDDIEFGQQFKDELMSDPQNYPILDPVTYAAAYQHLYRMRDEILQSNDLQYKDKFPWEVFIINNDSVVNAFATPGGYLYFYTGLIKFLDNEAQFAGVMAHEVAHSDRRHSTNQMTKAYGLDVLISIALGEEASELSQMVAGLASGLSSLAFSRAHEYEADAYAVKYLSDSPYDPRGLKGFFEKLHSETFRIPSFLSTHPSPEDRLEKIDEEWVACGSVEGDLFESSYMEFKSALP